MHLHDVRGMSTITQSMLEHHRQMLDNERRNAAEQVAAAKRAQADASTAAASSAREGAASQLRETQAQLAAAEHTVLELQQALEESRTVAHTRCGEIICEEILPTASCGLAMHSMLAACTMLPAVHSHSTQRRRPESRGIRTGGPLPRGPVAA